jgi:hypothetical protein
VQLLERWWELQLILLGTTELLEYNANMIKMMLIAMYDWKCNHGIIAVQCQPVWKDEAIVFNELRNESTINIKGL